MNKKRKYQTVRAEREPKPEVIQFPCSVQVKVGDVVMRRPISFSDTDSKNAQLMRGVVVWVHPKGRFHVVEFGEGRKAVRESFSGVNK